MRGDLLQDRLHYAWGVAARYVGNQADAYRPTGSHNPLDTKNKFLRLATIFRPLGGGMLAPVDHATSEWQGIFDASYTQPGDFLVEGNRIFFIAVQQPLLPVLCVQTNRIISIVRPAVQRNVGANSYGGYSAGAASILMSEWPASMLGNTGKGAPAAGLPTDEMVPYVEVLLPYVPPIILSPGDIIGDDLGRSIVISAAELTELGWRITARLATT
jgi:hypothetical protein